MNRVRPAPITATRRVGFRLINDMGPLSATKPRAPSRPQFAWEHPSTRAQTPYSHCELALDPPPHGAAVPLPLSGTAPWHRNSTPSQEIHRKGLPEMARPG